MGVFGPGLPVCVLGLFTGNIYHAKQYWSLPKTIQKMGMSLTPDGSYFVVGESGRDFMVNMNEPSEHTHATAHVIRYSVGSVNHSSEYLQLVAHLQLLAHLKLVAHL